MIALAPPQSMTAVIVSAGAGTRLLPLTLAMPKCLVRVGGRAILDHQLDALEAAGVGRAVVVAGYRGDQIADHVARESERAIEVEVLFNPFWSTSSSIGSVWAAKDHVERPFLLLNGDTVFTAHVIADALAAARPGVNLVVEKPDAFDIDDMRVALEDGRVADVGKDLPAPPATHRSLGLILSRDATGGYARALKDTIAQEDGLQAYHHDVIARIARGGGSVHAIVETTGDWQEIDRAADIAAWTRDHGGSFGEVA